MYSASLRAETWRMSGRDMEHAVGDDEEESESLVRNSSRDLGPGVIEGLPPQGSVRLVPPVPSKP